MSQCAGGGVVLNMDVELPSVGDGGAAVQGGTNQVATLQRQEHELVDGAAFVATGADMASAAASVEAARKRKPASEQEKATSKKRAKDIRLSKSPRLQALERQIVAINKAYPLTWQQTLGLNNAQSLFPLDFYQVCAFVLFPSASYSLFVVLLVCLR